MTIKEVSDLIHKVIPEKYHMPNCKYNGLTKTRAEINTFASPEYVALAYNAIKILGIPVEARYAYAIEEGVTTAFVVYEKNQQVCVTIWGKDPKDVNKISNIKV